MPTINLNRPAIDAGQISAANLEAARQHSTGRVLHLCRVHIAGRDTCSGQCETGAGCDCTPLQPAGLDYQGRHETRRFGQQAEFVDTVPTDHAPLAAEACTDIGADDCRPPVTRWGVALVVLPWVLGVIGWAIWTRWPL